MSKLKFVQGGNTHPFGFSTGCLYKITDVCLPRCVDQLHRLGDEVIEVMSPPFEHFDRLNDLVSAVKRFKIKSIHMPLKQRVENTPAMRAALYKLERFYIAVGASLVVVHPESVDDWRILEGFSMQFAIENLDSRRHRWFDMDHFERFFQRRPRWKMVLDLNHCFTYDDSEALAAEYISRFGDRIAEVHLSGCSPEKGHSPLFKTQQIAIIDSLPKTDCPIVIESPVLNVNDLNKEVDYILSCQAS